jgi:hypothetical protein
VATLLYQAPDDVEEAVIIWLSSLGRVAITRRTDDPLPFRIVRNIAGDESVDMGTAETVVQIRTLCDKALGEDAARNECDKTHRAMLTIARELPDIPLSNGRNATIDYLTVFESPHWMDYGNDQILCKLARYQLGLSYA